MKFVMNLSINPAGLELLRSSGVDEIYIANDSDPEHFMDELIDADAFIVRVPLKRFGADLMSKCKKLRVIGRTGTGYDMIDSSYAASVGIPVVITPGANSVSVAEHALTLILALSKNLIESHDGVIHDNWNVRNSGKSFELSGRTAGIIGAGAIGNLVAKFCESLGMNVIKCNSRSTREELEGLLRASDVVSLHAPLNEKTRNMISESELAMMKDSAILVNTSRSGLVNQSALIYTLKSGLIAGAGLDVFDSEPPSHDDELLSCPNVIFTPHSAGSTNEASLRTVKMCVEGCLAVLNHKRWPYVADEQVYSGWEVNE